MSIEIEEGAKSNDWTLLQELIPGHKGRWLCRCRCGTEKDVSTHNLKYTMSKGCGCSRIVDLSGKQFGRLTVLRFDPASRGTRRARWSCLCECGSEKSYAADQLQKGEADNCGCLTSEKLRIATASRGYDLEGETSGLLTYIKEAGFRNGARMITCSCACGNEHTLMASSFITGSTKSCGCLFVMHTEHKKRVARDRWAKIETLTCSTCRQNKPLDQFRTRSNGQPVQPCKHCRTEYDRVRYLKEKEDTDA